MRSDARANRQDLVEAASRLLAEHGPGMSLRAVAQSAGVGVGTLYRHFPARRDLLAAVLEKVVARLESIFLEFLAGEAPIRGRWDRLARELAAEDLGSLLGARDALSPQDCPPEEVMDEAEARILALADRAVARAAEAGLVADGVTGADYFSGLLVVTRPPLPGLQAYLTVTQEWLVDVYLRGLRPVVAA